MSNGELTQIPRNLLFRYRFPIASVAINANQWFDLPEHCSLPAMGRLEGQRNFADWKIGWQPTGLAFQLDVTGKTQSLWCRTTQLLESDGCHLWIDTRNTQSVHRATRYCHYLLAMPMSGPTQQTPFVTMLKINRAREDSPNMNRAKSTIHAKVNAHGYAMRWFIPGAALNGWDPQEQTQLGFCCAIADREMGWQTLATGPELPIFEDPSLWSTIDLLPLL